MITLVIILFFVLVFLILSSHCAIEDARGKLEEMENFSMIDYKRRKK